MADLHRTTWWWLMAAGVAASSAAACGDDAAHPTGDDASAGATTGEGASDSSPTTGAAGLGGAGGAGAGGADGVGGGGSTAGCTTTFDDDVLHLAVGASLQPGEDRTMCLRWTAPDDVDVIGIEGTLGPAAGHHALVLVHPEPSGPDGVSPCSESELMDRNLEAGFQMIAGVSYESDGVRYGFPVAPVQLGLRIAKGQQIVLDGHFINSGPSAVDACASMDFELGDVFVPLEFRTVLPDEQYDLVVPANGSIDVTYQEPIGERYRVAAASSHMHEGGRQFRMSVAETDLTLYEGDDWADPVPRQFDGAAVVIDAEHTFQLNCSFVNESNTDISFPDQMCVGGLYLLPCSFPGACPGD